MAKNIKLNENILKVNLSNNIDLILDPIKHVNSIAVGFYLKRGSRDETEEQLGYSHFCEHMIFKGTHKLNNKELTCRFDKMGGYINAYTTQESIVLYNRIPNYLFDENMDLFHQMFTASLFNNKEFEMERNVIINEIRSELEDPQEKAYEYFILNLFKKQQLGYPIIGNELSIINAKRNDLFNYYNNNFVNKYLSIVISGNVNKNKIVDKIKDIEFLSSDKNIPTKKATQSKEKYIHNNLSSEQVHLVLGTSSFDATGYNYFKYSLLNTILGESMSSIFFQKIREELGLCYSIYTFFSKFRFENIFGLYMSVIPKNIRKAISTISEVILDLLKNGINNDILEKSKEQKIGEIILNYDILNKRMQRIAFMDIKLGKIYTFKELIDIYKNISLDEINDIIKELFVKDNFFTQTVYKKELKLQGWEF